MANQKEEQREANLEAGGTPCPHKQREGTPCDWILGPSWEMESGRGYVYYVDGSTPNRGFVHRHNLEGFRGFTGHKQKISMASSELSNTVLSELDDLGASSASMAIAGRLLEIAESKNSAAAVQSLDRMSVRLGETWSTLKPPASSEKCKLCGRTASGKVHITISEEAGREFVRNTNKLMASETNGRDE